jgi:hypothetical protein
MKKFALCLMTCLSLTLLPIQLKAGTPDEPTTVTAPDTKSKEATEVKNLELRLNEIKSMDMSKMKSSEKRKLRKEVKSINHRMHDIGGGVYISAGAIILVLILLLILL